LSFQTFPSAPTRPPLPAEATGPTPTKDGDCNSYCAIPGYRTFPPVIYVNGMSTNGSTHRETALYLSWVTQHVVLGIYNLTAGFVSDLKQCFDDQSNLIPLGGVEEVVNTAAKLGVVVPLVGPLGVAAPAVTGRQLRNLIPESVLSVLVESKLRNPATVSLFRLLKQEKYKSARIVCHSQGNLITSNALWGLYSLRNMNGYSHMRVYALASPSISWAPGLNPKLYTIVNDPVTWVSAGRSYKDAERGFHSYKRLNPIEPHNITNYMGPDMPRFERDITADLRTS
jgi:hypothetical protein